MVRRLPVRHDRTRYLADDYGKGECNSTADLFVLALRAMGIAAAKDVIPAWGTSRGGHVETVYFDTDGNPESLMSGNNLGARPVRVYRVHYAPRVDACKAAGRGFSPYWEDVTTQYALTSDIRIEVYPRQVEGVDPTAVRLAVYGSRTWRDAVAANGIEIRTEANTGRKRAVCLFRNVGRSIIYLPVVAVGNVSEPIAQPFTLDYKGNITLFALDTAHRTTMDLTTLLQDGPPFLPEEYVLLYWDGTGWSEHTFRPERDVCDSERPDRNFLSVA